MSTYQGNINITNVNNAGLQSINNNNAGHGYHDSSNTTLESSENKLRDPVNEGEGWWRINNIRYHTFKKLGKGPLGTKVFSGKLGEREVAVKQLDQENWKTADREAALLVIADRHSNVIRYFCTEKSTRFVYLALDLCDANLQECVKGKYKHPHLDVNYVLDGAIRGVAHLHNLEPPIVHRDIKDTNVLVQSTNDKEPPKGLIADLGLSQQLKLYHDTFSISGTISGTAGWMAPEMLMQLDDYDKQKIISNGLTFINGSYINVEPSVG